MNHWKSIVKKWLNEDLSIRRVKLSQSKNRWFLVIKDGAFETIEGIFDKCFVLEVLRNTDLSYFLCNFLWLQFFSCLLKKRCQTNVILDHNALGTKCFAKYITLISLSFVNVELFLVNTETPLKSRNQCRCFKGPTVLNLQHQRSILILFF